MKVSSVLKSKGRVLIIEDDEMARLDMRTILEKRGHDVFEASDGDEGISEFKTMITESQAPDLVIVDLLIPGKGCYEMIVEIKETSPGVKIIAVMGGVDGQKVNFEISKILGADQTLSRPFSSEELLEAVGRCMSANDP